MPEFIIRRVDGDPFDFGLNQDAMAQVLRPISLSSYPIPGWGSHRIAIPGGEIIFSDEFVGLQVIVEAPALSDAEALKLVEEICQRIIQHTGRQIEVVEI